MFEIRCPHLWVIVVLNSWLAITGSGIWKWGRREEKCYWILIYSSVHKTIMRPLISKILSIQLVKWWYLIYEIIIYKKIWTYMPLVYIYLFFDKYTHLKIIKRQLGTYLKTILLFYYIICSWYFKLVTFAHESQIIWKSVAK